MRNERVLVLAEVALAIALAAVLNTIQFIQLPQGGSISLSMLPIIVVALRRGLGPGIVTGAAYGVIDYFYEPYFFHWIQWLLDYAVAFGAVGLAGFFAPAWKRAVADHAVPRAIWTVVLPAAVLGTAARLAVHVVSGLIFFVDYAEVSLMGGLAYSVTYNLSYMLPSAIACTAGAMILMPALRNVGVREPNVAVER
jgi:thiamine transporter